MLDWLLSHFSKTALKFGAGTAESLSTIPKNRAETEKARLEIERLKSAKLKQNRLIAEPTYAQVLEHSNLFRKVSRRVSCGEGYAWIRLSDVPESPDDFGDYVFFISFIAFGLYICADAYASHHDYMITRAAHVVLFTALILAGAFYTAGLR
jgi:hypothetical protein